MNTNTQLTI
jgi:putative transposase